MARSRLETWNNKLDARAGENHACHDARQPRQPRRIRSRLWPRQASSATVWKNARWAQQTWQEHASIVELPYMHAFALTDRSTLLAVAHGEGVLLLELLDDFLRVALTFAQPTARRQHRGAGSRELSRSSNAKTDSLGTWTRRRSWQGPARS